MSNEEQTMSVGSLFIGMLRPDQNTKHAHALAFRSVGLDSTHSLVIGGVRPGVPIRHPPDSRKLQMRTLGKFKNEFGLTSDPVVLTNVYLNTYYYSKEPVEMTPMPLSRAYDAAVAKYGPFIKKLEFSTSPDSAFVLTGYKSTE